MGESDNQLEKDRCKDKKRRLASLIYPSLSVFETTFLTSTWIFIVLYSWYLVYLVSRKYYLHFINYGFMVKTQFNQFWSHLSDQTDQEWNVFSENLLYTIPWIMLHFVGSQLLRKTNKIVVPAFNVILSMIYMGRVMGMKPTIWMFFQPLVMFLVHLMGSSLWVWVMSFVFLFSAKKISGPLYYINTFFLNECTDNENYVAQVTWCWVNSRCVSFCLDRIWKEVEPSSKGKIHDIVEMFAYCFYLPINISGPILIYKDFHVGFNKDYQPWTMKRLIHFFLQILRYSFWFLIAHVMLHFFYQSSIRHDMEVLQSLGLWTLAGVGFSVGGFFNLKYVIFYGLPRPFVVEDGIDKAPPHPKCIYRIHRYSEMWRYFDNGLYLFLKKYIYQPIIGTQVGGGGAWRKILGATSTFTFIYVWHGTSHTVMLWSIFNYMAVMTEMFASALGNYPPYANLEKRLLSPRGQRRFHAALASPLYTVSVLSNLYFFMGSEVGNYFVYRAFTSWPIETPLVLLFGYFASQFSIEVKNWELLHEINFEKPKDE